MESSNQRDLTGKKFGRWTVIEKTRVYSGKWRTAWVCECDCGTRKVVKQDNLVSGKSLSCGCLNKEVVSALRSSKRDLSGKRFGRWTAITRTTLDDKRHSTAWHCICDCGTERDVSEDNLVSGRSRSCGCAVSEISRDVHIKHGDSTSRLYGIWTGMRERCNNANNESACNYIDRGINICEEWDRSYESFRAWAYSYGYSDSLSIDRIDNNRGYCPDNCRWADSVTQANNKRNNLYIEWHGEIHTLAQWCRMLDLPYKKTHARYRYLGWDIDMLFGDTA